MGSRNRARKRPRWVYRRAKYPRATSRCFTGQQAGQDRRVWWKRRQLERMGSHLEELGQRHRARGQSVGTEQWVFALL